MATDFKFLVNVGRPPVSAAGVGSLGMCHRKGAFVSMNTHSMLRNRLGEHIATVAWRGLTLAG